MRGVGENLVWFACVVVRVGCGFDKWKEAGRALSPESTGVPGLGLGNSHPAMPTTWI